MEKFSPAPDTVREDHDLNSQKPKKTYCIWQNKVSRAEVVTL